MFLYVLQFIIVIGALLAYFFFQLPEWLVFAGLIVTCVILEEILDEMRETTIYVPEDEWIAVTKALPPEPKDGNCLEYNVIEPEKSEVTTLIYFGSGVWIDNSFLTHKVTHWRSLPPKIDEDDK